DAESRGGYAPFEYRLADLGAVQLYVGVGNIGVHCADVYAERQPFAGPDRRICDIVRSFVVRNFIPLRGLSLYADEGCLGSDIESGNTQRLGRCKVSVGDRGAELSGQILELGLTNIAKIYGPGH